MHKTVLITGGFDPLHRGHISYLQHARSLGDRLVVGINSDQWLVRKKGQAFMPFEDRRAVITALGSVDLAIAFDDDDGTACDAIRKTRQFYPNDRIIFANGGDRTQQNIPEMDIKDDNLEFKFGIGGTEKANSSSWLLDQWRHPRTDRDWGHYRVLANWPGTKVKELTVDPGSCLSMQRHKYRAEFWFVTQGQASVYRLDRKTDADLIGVYGQHEYIFIDVNQWHQLCNHTSELLKIVEIQYGDQCQEQDIERK